jgi:hypothetical protein
MSKLTPMFSSLTCLSWEAVKNFQVFVSIFGGVVEYNLVSLGESILYKFL